MEIKAKQKIWPLARINFMPGWLPYVIMAAGAGLRIYGLTAGALWYDEAYSLRLTEMPLLKMVQVAYLDFNPPGWEILAWPFVKIFGANAFGLRILSLIASLLILWLVWQLVENMRPAEKLAAITLVSFMPITFWMAQDGRNYALFSALYLAGFLFAKQRRWLGMAAAMGLSLYLHVTGVFYCAALGLAELVLSEKQDHKKIILAGAAALILWIPGLIVLLKSTAGLDFWLPAQTLAKIRLAYLSAFFVNTLPGGWVWLFHWVFTFSFLAAAVLTFGPAITNLADPVSLRIGAIAAEYLKIKRPEKTRNTIQPDKSLIALGIFAAGPVVFMAIAGGLWKPMIFYRPLQASVIPLCLWFAAILTPKRLTFTTWLLPYAWAIMLTIGVMVWSPAAKGGGIDLAADLINSNWQPGDLIYHATATSYLPFSYYTDHDSWLLDAENEPDGLLQVRIQKAMNIPRSALENLDYKRIWFVWARDPILTEESGLKMAQYTKGAELVFTVKSFQFAPIEVYLWDGEK